MLALENRSETTGRPSLNVRLSGSFSYICGTRHMPTNNVDIAFTTTPTKIQTSSPVLVGR